MLLAYRFSGGVPSILETLRLIIAADGVTLEVGEAARAPDSEVVFDCLNLPAAAIGVSRVTVTEFSGRGQRTNAIYVGTT